MIGSFIVFDALFLTNTTQKLHTTLVDLEYNVRNDELVEGSSSIDSSIFIAKYRSINCCALSYKDVAA